MTNNGATRAPRHGGGNAHLRTLIVAALGVVFGDIGTSPLYAMQTALSIEHGRIEVNHVDIYGLISLVFWSVTIIVSFKYVVMVMRADNEGEGGVLALTALLSGKLRGQGRIAGVALALGMIGAGLFYGDSLITPAISVLSAVEGLQVANPAFEPVVLPIALVIITGLFAAQRFGTGAVGRFFGPVMIAWFCVLGVLGIPHIIAHPGIFAALGPWHAIIFWVERPAIAFLAMGAVVLTVTGAEALYADMGHFGAPAIRRAWFMLVFPALTLNYLGQGALLLNEPGAAASPFFNLAPEWARLPLVVLATIATVIASQAVISGAFSVTNQAMRLGLLPNFRVRHTSNREYGQVYLPAITMLLYVGVLALTLGFRSSTALASAYGLAVTGTEVLATTLFLLLARTVRGWAIWKLVAIAIPIATLEYIFLAANATKFFKGGWLPLAVAAVVILVMSTWLIGSRYVLRRRAEIEGSLDEFLDRVQRTGVVKVPGQAVYLHANPQTAPLALKENVRFNHVLHERVFILRVKTITKPYVDAADRVRIDPLPHPHEGIWHLTLTLGFNERRDVPQALREAAERLPELELEPDEVRYFASVLTLHAGGDSPMSAWRKHLYIWLARNAAIRGEAFHLPANRTMVMGGTLEL